MIILGIGDSHEAHACIVRDGELVAVMSEERLSRLKADMGYPRQSIEAVMKLARIAPAEIDAVAFAGLGSNMLLLINKVNALFSVKDWVEQCHTYWGPVLLESKKISPFVDFDNFNAKFADRLGPDPYVAFVDRARSAPPDTWRGIAQDIRRKTVCEHLGIAPEKVMFMRHESCHQAYGAYSAKWLPDSGLVLHIEGGGDDSSASVSTYDRTKLEIKQHWSSNAVNAGRLYRYITLLLGMQPGQHEYKVMGLAPYGSEYGGRRSLEYFRKINHVVGGEILNDNTIRELYFTSREALEGERFDGIAWGLQSWLEELLCQWVRNNIGIYGTGNVVITGGVAQNIKACKAIADMPEVDLLWSPPIAGDGSLGIGAAWLASQQLAPSIPIKGLETIYLGTAYTPKDVAAAIDARKLCSEFNVIDKPSHDDVANWIGTGNVVARFSGRMEFGQRALGNRSILADPRRYDTIDRLNRKVKYRDFWMPFTPSMTEEEAARMVHNPKKIYSPYMTMAYDLKPEFRDAIPAAVHPADRTARPQMLRRVDNNGYYDLISAFGRRTGINCLLNTSFNLHGDSIVESPDDAIHTFLNSEIDILLFDDVAVARPKVGRAN